jgi:hypothetical protein
MRSMLAFATCITGAFLVWTITCLPSLSSLSADEANALHGGAPPCTLVSSCAGGAGCGEFLECYGCETIGVVGGNCNGYDPANCINTYTSCGRRIVANCLGAAPAACTLTNPRQFSGNCVSIDTCVAPGSGN